MPPDSLRFLAILAVFIASTGIGHAADLSGKAPAGALREGGYVLLMCHASSPERRPAAGTADSGNKGDERELDAGGADIVARIEIEEWQSSTPGNRHQSHLTITRRNGMKPTARRLLPVTCASVHWSFSLWRDLLS